MKRETAHEVRWTSVLRGPERSGDIRTSSPGLDSNKVKRISIRISFLLYESARRDSNPRPSPWQGDTPPLSHSRISLLIYYVCKRYNTLSVGYLSRLKIHFLDDFLKKIFKERYYNHILKGDIRIGTTYGHPPTFLWTNIKDLFVDVDQSINRKSLFVLKWPHQWEEKHILDVLFPG